MISEENIIMENLTKIAINFMSSRDNDEESEINSTSDSRTDG